MAPMALGEILPAVNAGLNSLSAVLLGLGYLAIRCRRVGLHWRLMTSACVVSAIFLGCYLLRVALTGTHRYPGTGLARALYLVILTTHMTLAVLVPPLALWAVLQAVGRRYDRHRRVVRWLWPMWMYVSVTGVLVYFMLYRWN